MSPRACRMQGSHATQAAPHSAAAAAQRRRRRPAQRPSRQDRQRGCSAGDTHLDAVLQPGGSVLGPGDQYRARQHVGGGRVGRERRRRGPARLGPRDRRRIGLPGHARRRLRAAAPPSGGARARAGARGRASGHRRLHGEPGCGASVLPYGAQAGPPHSVGAFKKTPLTPPTMAENERRGG